MISVGVATLSLGCWGCVLIHCAGYWVLEENNSKQENNNKKTITSKKQQFLRVGNDRARAAALEIVAGKQVCEWEGSGTSGSA